MTKTRTGWARSVAASLILALLSLATTSTAGESASPKETGPVSLAAAVEAKAERVAKEELATATAQPAATTTESDSGESFFKTGKGKAALALFVVAAGYTLFSKYDDRVKSVIR